jgi:hydroxymethylpyrimidine pyrophosphatase-like HAD family hydrolase/fructoselysine-6-P-deglycase FrlB-like protein
MGKPYQSEIAALPRTISWALSADIRGLSAFVAHAHGTPLIATGSGGSLSAAKLASVFHQLAGAGFSKSMTPLELASLNTIDANSSFLLLSAGGANNDIRMVFQRLAAKDPKFLATVTGRIGTPIAKLAQGYPCCESVELGVPSGKDGFLATNSLMAFCVVIARAYAEAQKADSSFATLRSFVENKNRWEKHVAALDATTSSLWKRKHLVVLYSPDLEAAATDIESKFTEAALGTTQIADYRHFAHGRHHWLAKHGQDCGVLAFFTPQFQRIAVNTIRCLPKSIPTVQMPFPDNVLAAGLGAMLTSVLLAGFAGRERGIDPGRPGVPPFGRKIYHLRWVPPTASCTETIRAIGVGTSRKLQAIGKEMNALPGGPLSLWTKAGHAFCLQLANQPMRAVVLDYDGTMVFTNRRFDPIQSSVSLPLIRLIRNGVIVGVASGRGKSLRETLQKTIPYDFWSRVVVGYYNGSQTGLLSDNSLPKRFPVEDELAAMQQRLVAATTMLGQVEIEGRHNQLSLTPKDHLHVEDLWSAVAEFLNETQHPVKVVRSGHSVDIITKNTSKRAVVDQVCNLAGSRGDEVLRIGDKGRWPGNDFELLKEFPSLSVDEVSTDCETCWNLAPVGCRGPDALAAYLSSAELVKRGFVLDPKNIHKSMP